MMISCLTSCLTNKNINSIIRARFENVIVFNYFNEITVNSLWKPEQSEIISLVMRFKLDKFTVTTYNLSVHCVLRDAHK